ncbi:hypothetical protein [Intestinibacter bartlettii]|uniref:DUF4397 domain-containing protein n=1 Tax=Intestinibacter bartlettii TaxID=261299 RepID=A0ABS6DYT2_9FIRM|nr:hypothetical protein [Intestinibacter bartlettii]MBU5337000.1 hypothetical protein [Intestinibacter bartlettii]MDO5011367.1 hypothetical protein [Intestinibacter bartlettii]
MQYNNSSMNTRVKKGNRYTQDMMIDPRQFVMGEGEFNYQEVPPMQQMQQLPPMQQPAPPNVPCGCKPQCPSKQVCNEVCEPITVTDSTYTSCATVNCNSGSSNNCCDNSIVAPPITAANSMTRLIAGYQVSDMIKFDRVATSATPVLAAGPLTSPTVTVTGAPLNPGTYKFKISEVCFGDINLAINTGAPTLGGVALTQTNVFNTTYTRLVRSPINLPASLQCCKQCLGTTLEYNQPTLSATVSSPTAPTTETIPVLLRGKCGCTNIEVRTTINVQTNILFTFDSLKGTLCRRPNLTPVLADQYYQTKLTLGCINATITAPTVAGGTYTITIVDAVYANLVMRLTVSLLSYGTMAVLSTVEPVQARDIPVQTANFDFDSCLQ